MKKAFFSILCLFVMNLLNGQGFDSIYVEKIKVSPQAIAEDPNLNLNSITYRVFISMKPGYLMASVQGTFGNPLLFKTTTSFYNHEDGEVIPTFRPIPEMSEALYYDSWLTIGQYGRQSAASQLIPLIEDNDGKVNGIKLGAVSNATALDPATYFERIWGYQMGPGADFGTPGYDPENVIYYAAGGVSGIGPSNSVCIGQFTTDGIFSMELNIQLIPPTGPAEVYVVREKIQTDHIISNKIIYPPNIQPSVKVTSPANGSIYKLGENVNFTAQATDEDGNIVDVILYAGLNQMGTYTQPPYSTNFKVTQKGALNLYAVARDNRYGRDTSSIVTIYANQPPAVTLISPVEGSTYELLQQIPLEANAFSADGQVTKVEFYINSNLVATLSAPPFRTSWLADVAGVKEITAKVYDNLNGTATSNKVSLTVNTPGNTPPIVNLLSPKNGDIFTVGQEILLKAEATDPDPQDLIVRVEFFSNGIKIGESSTTPFNLPWLSNIAGSKVLTAIATDSRGGKTTCGEITIIFNILPYVVITSPTSGDTFNAGDGFTVQATATDQDGSIAKVELLVNEVLTGEFSLISGNNYFSTLSSGAGTKVLKAVATDNYGGKYISEAVNITVNNNTGVTKVTGQLKKLIKVYPNPVHDMVTIHFQQEIGEGKAICQVIDALGRVMISKDINTLPGENIAELDVIQLPAGVYFIRLSSNDGSLAGIARIMKK